MTAVDVLSGGRFDLGVGQGYVKSEFTGFAIPRGERAQRLEEGVVLIKRLFEEDNVHFDGRFTKVGGATLSPRPVQRPGPPLWIGARGEKAIRRVARLGCHLMCTLGPDPAPMYLSALRKKAATRLTSRSRNSAPFMLLRAKTAPGRKRERVRHGAKTRVRRMNSTLQV